MAKISTPHRDGGYTPGVEFGCLLAVVYLLTALPGVAATVDFDSLDVGTLFGLEAGDQRNDVVLLSDGIAMSVDALLLPEDAWVFGSAEVGGRYADLFTSNPLVLNNISVVFDFADVGFSVDTVMFDYLDVAEGTGVNNFAVNHLPILPLNYVTDIPVDIAPGVSAAVSGTATQGSVTLTGPLDSFRIGGQELYIDNITAIPEPTTLLMLGLGGTLLARRCRRQS
ncbi:MAG: PEP-CTERM sorting domain-containing protein [Phycisphaerae bacterium]